MIKIKFLCGGDYASMVSSWRRQLPDVAPEWDGCEFVFDTKACDYDWLVVYDRFPSVSGERFSMWHEKLACPSENTVFVTVEPSSIKSYESAFLKQFGHVLTGHEEWSIRHPGVIRSQPALRWFYGDGGERLKTFDEMLAEAPPRKLLNISTVCSVKQQKHTLHQKRYEFTQQLKHEIAELDVFGRGVKAMSDKAEAIDPYRFHIAIENHRCDHHWTEKVSDVFLGWGLPLYYGCTNLADYFPAESFIEIDINDLEGTVELIRNLLEGGEYERRLSAIVEARRLVLNEYNMFAVLAKLARGEGRPEPNHPSNDIIRSRHLLRKSSPAIAVSYAIQSIRRRWRGLRSN